MTILTKDTITDYLKIHMPFLDYSRPLIISAVGDGDIEEDGDGYINFVYRVSDGRYKLILKQAQTQGRMVGDYVLPLDRAELEYDTMRLRASIVPEYLPKLYFNDPEEHIFVEEDVSHLQIMRFQLIKNRIYPKFAEQAAEFLAKSHFYTSEYYLDTDTFRKLTIRFMNHRMRNIFDTGAFTFKRIPEESFGGEFDPRFMKYVRDMCMDPQVAMVRHQLRHAYISKAETLIHGDYHTSNTFIDENEMKVIDMEYTFAGPLSYDMGYMMGQLLAQYFTVDFRSYGSEEERKAFKDYMRDTMREFYEGYCRVFFACWDEDAKDVYRDLPLLQEDVRQNLLREMAGFCANTNLGRCAGDIGFPEYDMLDDPLRRIHAVCISILCDVQVLKNYRNYTSYDDFWSDIEATEAAYKEHFDW